MYFEIKMKHLIVEAPQHIVTHLRLVRHQSQLVQQVVEPHIRSGAWFAHSEPLLLSLLASSDQDERCFAVDVILKLRGNSKWGGKGVRTRNNPHLNIHATKITGSD